jgi:uncharacterized ion transporter superfamily protein YfcC
MNQMKKIQIPHTYVIIFSIIVIAAVFTWFVPGGVFEREKITTSGGTSEVIKTDSFRYVENSPQTWQIFSAFYKGFVRSPKIIVFILILGGAFWLINESRAIDTGVYAFLQKSARFNRFRLIRRMGVNNIIITVVMLMFSAFGAIFGMSEETIAFVVIFVPLAISMGYDSIVGVCMCFIGAGIGFAGCLMNPFTLGIAQEIAGLQLFSGLEYRFFIWMVVNAVGISYVLWYANRIKKNPKRSLTYNYDSWWREQHANTGTKISERSKPSTRVAYFTVLAATVVSALWWPTNPVQLGAHTVTLPALPVICALYAVTGWLAVRRSVQVYVLIVLIFTILYLVVGVTGFQWGLLELASLFFGMALIAGVAMGRNANEITRSFVAGAKDILSAALVVGLAGGIIVILEDGKIIDTILYTISNSIAGSGEIPTLSLMYLFQSGLNMIITSGTAKAALIMPILRDVSDMVNLSKQATVTAFHIGDGFTNLITPTSGVLIGVLEMARIPFGVWFRWAWKLILILVVLGWILLIPTVTMNLNGF